MKWRNENEEIIMIMKERIIINNETIIINEWNNNGE